MAVGSVLVTAIILLHTQIIHKLDLPALVAIIFFNLLFAFLLFPLEGPLLRKIVLLIAGNIVGVFWYARAKEGFVKHWQHSVHNK